MKGADVTTSPRTVLLVDDSDTVRRMLEWILRPAGLETVDAPDGLRALEILRDRKVDLAVVDLNMPGMDGIEFLRTVRATPEIRDLPVIMLTTESREEDKRLAYEAGANLYLHKPSTPAVIRYKVLSLLGLPDPEARP
jgi:two-component system chemotaxis response regulator CheY